MSVLIDIDEEKFSNDIKRIQQSLCACNYIDGLSEAKNKLKTLRDDTLSKGALDEDNYLSFASFVLDCSSVYMEDFAVAKLCLDLSRLHCNVRELYEDKDVTGKLLSVAAKEPLDYTDLNKVLIEDFTYSFYYWEAKKHLKDGGIESVVAFLKEDVFLGTPKGLYIVESMISNIVSRLELDETKLKYLKDNFGKMTSLIANSNSNR